MSVVAVTVLLAALVVLLLRTSQLRLGSAAVCVLFGLVLGLTPAAPAVQDAVVESGGWLWTQVRSL